MKSSENRLGRDDSGSLKIGMAHELRYELAAGEFIDLAWRTHLQNMTTLHDCPCRAKAVRLGGGLALSPDAPAAKWIAALSALLEPGRFAPACASLARRMAADPSGAERMADYVERLHPAGVAAAA